MLKRCRNFGVVWKNEHLSLVWYTYDNREISGNEGNLHANVSLSD